MWTPHSLDMVGSPQYARVAHRHRASMSDDDEAGYLASVSLKRVASPSAAEYILGACTHSHETVLVMPRGILYTLGVDRKG